MKSIRVPVLVGATILLGWTGSARAGMPSPIGDETVEAWLATGLKETAVARLQSLSFFLMGFLLSALLIQLLWNAVRKDWSFLPRLTYAKALGVVFLWGLLFVLVLTMISGARELLTPGAWEKQGVTYHLKGAPEPPETESLEKKREQQLIRVKTALWQFAAEHHGHFPDTLAAAGLTKENQQVPDLTGMSYIYVKGLTPGQGKTPLLYEPDIFGPERLVLFSNGEIRPLKSNDLQQALATVTP
jgi:hypothetical protein